MFLVVGCMGIWSVESQAFFGRGGGGGAAFVDILKFHVFMCWGFVGLWGIGLLRRETRLKACIFKGLNHQAGF